MKPAASLQDDLRRSEIEQARPMSEAAKLFAGPRLYDAVRERAAWGVLLDEPDATPRRIRQVVTQRLFSNA